MKTLDKKTFFEALKKDRLYSINIEKSFNMMCESHDGIESALSAGTVILDGNDIWMTNGSEHKSRWELVATINETHYNN